MATTTPWGKAQSSTKYARGVILYSTAGHGGFHLSKTMNEKVHPALREASGWYEEDCKYHVVVFTFPDLFPGKLDGAKKSLKEWYPDKYEAATGEKVTAEESHVIRERAFRAATKDKYVTVAAFGDWHKAVPKGFVGVMTVRGGRAESGHYASADEKHFIVSEEEYGFNHGPFVVDPSRHTEVAKFA